MKKYLLLSFCILSISKISAQTNTFPSTGNVGIGITSPLYKLDVAGPIRFGGVGNYSSMILGTEETSLAGYHQSTYMTPSTVPGSGTARSMFRFKNNIGSIGKTLIDVIVDGNIGIGTTTPTTQLDLKGDLTIDGGEDSRLYTSDSPVELNKYLLLLNSVLNKSAIGLKAGGLLISDTYGYANPSKNDLVVKGNVSIGVTNTQGYKLAVNGNIRAKEIKVETASWPDYVFAKDYQLPSLQQTEKHIKEKGHLPGVPSAEEVKANGVDLGEMNAKLLQKIEELTLYLIEQGKEIKELKKEVKSLKSN